MRRRHREVCWHAHECNFIYARKKSSPSRANFYDTRAHQHYVRIPSTKLHPSQKKMENMDVNTVVTTVPDYTVLTLS